MDCDEAEHMQWLFKTSEKRAQEHGIEGVTLKFTQVNYFLSFLFYLSYPVSRILVFDNCLTSPRTPPHTYPLATVFTLAAVFTADHIRCTS